MRRREFLSLLAAAPIALNHKIYLPCVLGPQQWGGTQEYLCELGEEVYGVWYISTTGILRTDWHVFDFEDQKFEVVMRTLPVPKAGRYFGWLKPKPYASIRRVVWYSLEPAWFVEGSCVI